MPYLLTRPAKQGRATVAAALPRDNWMGATGVAGGSLRAFPFLFNLHVHLTPRAPQCLENASPPPGRRSKLHRQDTVDGLGHPIPESRQLGRIAVPNASPDRPPPSWIALPSPAQGRLVGHLHPATPSGPPTQALEVPGYAPISPSSHPPEPPTHGFGHRSKPCQPLGGSDILALLGRVAQLVRAHGSHP